MHTIPLLYYCYAVICLTMKLHIEFQEQVATKSVLIDLLFVSSLLQSRNSGLTLS